ncbi:MAG: hypothetical protein VB025_12940 [Sphaerochaeta sp.]|nr:hypothetical protein [Sphaerochaeta sp.]
MESERKLSVIQNIYAASIAETVNTYQALGQLSSIVARKEARQEQTAPFMLQQLGIETEEEVFSRLSEVFGCANWHVDKHETGFVATATACKLCALSKKMGGASPCHGWCIDPMTAMIKEIARRKGTVAQVRLEGTLMEQDRCTLAITV